MIVKVVYFCACAKRRWTHWNTFPNSLSSWLISNNFNFVRDQKKLWTIFFLIFFFFQPEWGWLVAKNESLKNYYFWLFYWSLFFHWFWHTFWITVRLCNSYFPFKPWIKLQITFKSIFYYLNDTQICYNGNLVLGLSLYLKILNVNMF